jgi:hypothetical protein
VAAAAAAEEEEEEEEEEEDGGQTRQRLEPLSCSTSTSWSSTCLASP